MEGPVLARQKVRNRRNEISHRRPVVPHRRVRQIWLLNWMPRFAASGSRLPQRFEALGRSWVGVQRELGARVSLTQKSIYRMELGTHDLRRSTVVMVEQVLKAEGVEFEDLPGGGFKVVVPEAVLAKQERTS